MQPPGAVWPYLFTAQPITTTNRKLNQPPATFSTSSVEMTRMSYPWLLLRCFRSRTERSIYRCTMKVPSRIFQTRNLITIKTKVNIVKKKICFLLKFLFCYLGHTTQAPRFRWGGSAIAGSMGCCTCPPGQPGVTLQGACVPRLVDRGVAVPRRGLGSGPLMDGFAVEQIIAHDHPAIELDDPFGRCDCFRAVRDDDARDV